jgi:putative ABC transport system permease protein
VIIESVIITTFFGYIGMLLGIAAKPIHGCHTGHQTVDVGVGRAITTFLDPTVGLDVCVEATVLMIIAGTLAGFVPARRAANVQPIEALRAE